MIKVKETIIFLHGVVGNKNTFKTEMDKLKDQYNLIAYNFYDPNMLGQAYPFSLELLLEQLYTHYKNNRITTAHICTLSFGCIPAMAFAQKYPDMVTSLTFVGGYFCNVPSKLHTQRVQLYKEKQQFDYTTWLKRYAKSLNPNRKQIPEDSEAIFVKHALKLHPTVLEEAIRIQLEFDTRKVLKGMDVPILWVMGEYDELYKATLFELKQDVPHVEYIELKKAGHAAHIHQPEQFMSVFKPFIGKLSEKCR
ncbi:alpha/beta fold hydrolase [Domibacillus mangrovi]|uniref:Alpha/beta hydrolase n=1 Tax=Domibacillus mangrovi TaxID=1714354 RepID=A0A1Q5P2Y3_9BACI|nr:alpha/beta hydrolase [Domibacillus mangrovi]OKL36586.1 alpha/beta hydrolase [Domibacillus mangrovi]